MPLQAFALKWKCANGDENVEKRCVGKGFPAAAVAARCLFTLIVWPMEKQQHIKRKRGRGRKVKERERGLGERTSLQKAKSLRDKHTPR